MKTVKGVRVLFAKVAGCIKSAYFDFVRFVVMTMTPESTPRLHDKRHEADERSDRSCRIENFKARLVLDKNDSVPAIGE
jgi:hypothetical protein